jgi:hypothetical protein
MEGARYLEDGRLTIFRRSGIYYARLRIAASDKYICRSLKTSNEQTAIDLGRRLLFQIEQRAEEGLPPKSKLFAAWGRRCRKFRNITGSSGRQPCLQRDCPIRARISTLPASASRRYAEAPEDIR